MLVVIAGMANEFNESGTRLQSISQIPIKCNGMTNQHTADEAGIGINILEFVRVKRNASFFAAFIAA